MLPLTGPSLADDILLLSEEVAAILGTSMRTVQRWCQSGYIKSFQEFRYCVYRIPASELARVFGVRIGNKYMPDMRADIPVYVPPLPTPDKRGKRRIFV